MKIIKKGKKPTTFIRFCCSNCGCIFECEKGEYMYHLSGKRDNYYEAKCPTCSKKVYALKKGENND